MQETDFEVVPDQLIEAANEKFGLDEKPRTIKKPSFFKLPQWTNNRALAFATLAASVVILLSINDRMNPFDGPRPIITRSIPTQDNVVSSANLIDGLNVEIKGDTIFVKQPFRFTRSLIVISEDNNIILKKDFTKMDDSFELLGLSERDSIYIVIETLEEEVYRRTFYIKD